MCGQLANSSGFSNQEKPKKKPPKRALTAERESSTINPGEGLCPASKADPLASDKYKENLHLVGRGGQSLTQKAHKNFKLLSATTVRYSGTVQRKLSKSNSKPNPALVASAAKYYVALKKLADE